MVHFSLFVDFHHVIELRKDDASDGLCQGRVELQLDAHVPRFLEVKLIFVRVLVGGEIVTPQGKAVAVLLVRDGWRPIVVDASPESWYKDM